MKRTKKDAEPATVVVFRVWKEKNALGEVLALFPTIDAGHGMCMSYEHVGQHGAAFYDACLVMTRPAKRSEYAALASELRRIGYKLDIRVRRPAM